MHSILAVGLPRDVYTRLAEHFPDLHLDRADEPDRLVERLRERSWSLVLVNDRPDALPCEQALRAVRTTQAAGEDEAGVGSGARSAGTQLICVVPARLPAEVYARLVADYGVARLLLHPPAAGEVAHAVGQLLGVSAERPEVRRAREQRTREAAAGLWKRFRGQMMARVGALDRAVRGLLDGELDPDVRRAAARETHKLAGAVGTFGFPEGSRLAREAELLLVGDGPIPESAVTRLSELAAAIRAELETPLQQPAADELDVGADREAESEASPESRSRGADTEPETARLLERLRPGPARVLAVCDDPQVLALLRSELARPGHQLTTLGDPLRFWEVLSATDPDLLLLDAEMPRLSGVQLCRAVRDEARPRPLPALLLASQTAPDALRRLYDAGADDFVAKPIFGLELRRRVANLLERVRLQRALAEHLAEHVAQFRAAQAGPDSAGTGGDHDRG